MLIQENLPLNVFSSMKTLPKETNTCFTWPMKEEKDLDGNISGPTMEEFTLYKTMTVKPLLSEMTKTLNRSKSQQSEPEISVELLHLLILSVNSPTKYLFPPFGMVNDLHIVLTFAWCGILDLTMHLINNHGSVQNLQYA